VIAVSHRPNALTALNMAMVMNGGRSIAFGPREQVFARVAHCAVRGGALRQNNSASHIVTGAAP
jgi:ABC-type protease/lipase transport system fused ATPase/permease subunit